MNVLTELLHLAEKIPATFWGVVIGSFFSLGGVVLTNPANDRRLRAQLAHDRELRNRDRELSLRKDVYLAAAEAISAGLTAIGQLPDLEVPHNQLTAALLEKSPSIAKVHVIAKEETAKAVATLLGELSSAYLGLFAKRAPLIAQKSQIAFLKEQMGDFARERNRMLELTKQFNLDGAEDRHRWDVITGNFEFEQRRITEASTEHDTLVADLYAKQLGYMKECVGETIRLSRLLVPVLVAIRTELEMPINVAAYTQVIEGSVRKQEARMDEFLHEVQCLAAAQPL